MVEIQSCQDRMTFQSVDDQNSHFQNNDIPDSWLNYNTLQSENCPKSALLSSPKYIHYGAKMLDCCLPQSHQAQKTATHMFPSLVLIASYPS